MPPGSQQRNPHGRGGTGRGPRRGNRQRNNGPGRPALKAPSVAAGGSRPPSVGGQLHQPRGVRGRQPQRPQAAQNISNQHQTPTRVKNNNNHRAQNGDRRPANSKPEQKSIQVRFDAAQSLLHKRLGIAWGLGDRSEALFKNIAAVVNNLETPTILTTRGVNEVFEEFWEVEKLVSLEGSPPKKLPSRKQQVLNDLHTRLQNGQPGGQEQDVALCEVYIETAREFCKTVYEKVQQIHDDAKLRKRNGDLLLPDAPYQGPSHKPGHLKDPWTRASKTNYGLGEIELEDCFLDDEILVPGPRYGRIQHLHHTFPPINAPNTIEWSCYNTDTVPVANWLSLDPEPFKSNYYQNNPYQNNHQEDATPNNIYAQGPCVPLIVDAMGSTPTLVRFLNEINSIVERGDGEQLKEYLVIEPPFSELYIAMIQELRRAFPPIPSNNARDVQAQEAQLNMKCGAVLPAASVGKDNATWGAFVNFIVQYLKFIRDVNVNNLLETYDMLAEVVEKTNSALTHHAFGAMMIPTALVYAKVLARLAIGLDRQPDLIAHIPKIYKEDGSSESLPERAANTLRKLFVTCLNDHSPLKDGRPVGKKAVIYTIANTCLKVLFACKKVPGAEQIFNNIVNQSPPLSLYSASERVTYLYYLGRFHFATGHYYRAALTLQSAFDQTPSYYIQQRRRILIFLVTSNLILGRFPSSSCYALPEAKGFREKFYPITDAIRKGNLEKFERLTSLEHLDDPDIRPEPHAKWFYNNCILLQIRHCCLVLVWRSLLRRLLILVGDTGSEQRAANINLHHFSRILSWFEVRCLRNPSQLAYEPPGKRHTNHIFSAAEGRAREDFDEIRWKPNQFVHPDLLPDPNYATRNGFHKHAPKRQPVNKPVLTEVQEAEGIVAALISQGFVNGYMKHRSKLLVISGAKREGGALKHGFPKPWTAISERSDKSVPGWKLDDEVPNPFAGGAGALGGVKYGPGMVVNLSGVKPVGM